MNTKTGQKVKDKNHKTFDPPSWVKKLNEPTIKFNIDTPSYAEITKIIMKMKSPALACLNDAMSIIEFKKCPILRTIASSKNNSTSALKRRPW